MAEPRWATPARREMLLSLFRRGRGGCVRGCPWGACHHGQRFLYPTYSEELIREWVAADKAQDAAEWRAEQGRMHEPHQARRGYHGGFDPVRRDEFAKKQPPFRVVADGVTYRLEPVRLVRVSSTPVGLYVPKLPRRMRKTRAQRRAHKSGEFALDRTCAQAVQDWWAR